MFIGGNWFKIKTLSWQQWVICIILALMEFPVQVVIVLVKKFFDKSKLCHRRKRTKPVDSTVAGPAGSQAVVARAMNSAKEMLSGAGQAVVTMRSALRSSSNADMTRLVTSTGQKQQEKAIVEAAKAYRASNNSKKDI